MDKMQKIIGLLRHACRQGKIQTGIILRPGIDRDIIHPIMVIQIGQPTQIYLTIKRFVICKTGIQHHKLFKPGIEAVMIFPKLIFSIQHRLLPMNIFHIKITKQQMIIYDMNAIVNKKFSIQNIDFHPYRIEIDKTGNIRLIGIS